MLFNKDNNGTDEIRSLTGSYYRNNDFQKIASEIEAAGEELSTLVSKEVFQKAEAAYEADSEDETDMQLISKLQRPIALLAAMNLYRKTTCRMRMMGVSLRLTPKMKNYLGSGNLTGTMNYS